MSTKKQGGRKGTQIGSGRRERMRSVSAPQPIITVLEDAFFSLMHTSTRTVRNKERDHSRFLPLHLLPCHFLKIPRLPHPSIHPASQRYRPPAFLPSLAASPKSCHRESRLYESLLFLLLISAWQIGWSWLRFRYTDPRTFSSAL